MALPPVAKEAICDAVERQAECISIPMQHMLNLNPLLGKIKGRRTICKTPMLYRAMCRHIGTIDEWDINNEYVHDTAQKGNSAQLAALLRNLEAEIAIVLDFATGGFFFDYEKLFDHLDISLLLASCIKLQLPPRDIFLVVLQHTVPRALQCAGFTSIPRPIVRSISAGCRYSKVLTKVYLAEGMHTLAHKHRRVSLKTYFDDTTAIARGSHTEVHENLMDCVVDFRKLVQRLKLKISPKSTIVTSSAKLTKAICDELNGLGWQIRADRFTRDLGITFGAGVRKTENNLGSEIKKKN